MRMPFDIVVMAMAVDTGLGVGVGVAVGLGVGLGTAVGMAVGTSVGVALGGVVARASLDGVATIWACACFANFDRGCQAENGPGRNGEAATSTSSRTAMIPMLQAINRFTIVPFGRR